MTILREFCRNKSAGLILGFLSLALLGVIIALVVFRDGKAERSIVLTYQLDTRTLPEQEISLAAEELILPTLQKFAGETQADFRWRRTDQGIKVSANGDAETIRQLKKADRLIRLQLPGFFKAREIAQRQESVKKLQGLLRMLRLYGDDGYDKLPDSLEQLRQYDADGLLDWLLENVTCVARGRPFDKVDGPIAYDKKFLERGGGTNVLFDGGPVNFVKPPALRKLGIIPEEK